ncbi:MAG TPA: hypothetical protein VM942_03305, partial [Acidimicrobiales bacterium]|nr:hypothetical protein [Acidimicrobiales bacterium]
IRTLRAADAFGMAVDPAGNVFLSEGARVVKRSPDGTVTTVAGNGGAAYAGDGVPATQTGLDPGALALDGSGNLYIADHISDYSYIRRVDSAGVITTVAGAPSSWNPPPFPDLAVRTQMRVVDMTVGPDGALYVTSTHSGYSSRSVLRIHCGIASDISAFSTADWDDYGPQGLAVDRSGNVFYSYAGKVHRIGSDGTLTTVAGGGTVEDGEAIAARSAKLPSPMRSMALDGAGNLYVTTRDRVVKATGVSVGAGPPGPSCAFPLDRPVAAWGYNGLGALGDASFPGRSQVHTDQPPVTGATAVAAGAYHSLALKSDGTVWAWGWNAYGQLGDGTTASHSTPTRVVGLTDVRAISAGWLHNLAVTADGSVWAWGWNAYGQLGNGSTATNLTPRRVVGLTGATSVSGGAFASSAVKSDGTAWTWGWNGLGQLGDRTAVERHLPVRVYGLSDVTSVQLGMYHALAAKSDGSVWSWGWNGFGQLGDRTTLQRHAPVKIDLAGVTSVAAGAHHSLAVLSDGTVYAWGWNAVGQLGTGPSPFADSATPVRSPYLSDVKAVSAGLGHSVAVHRSGSLTGWGWNVYGQGSGITEGGPPWIVQAVPDVVAVSAGGLHTVAVFDFAAG